MMKTLICTMAVLASATGAVAFAQVVERLRSPFVLSHQTASGSLATFTTDRTPAVTWDILALKEVKGITSMTIKRTYVKSEMFTDRNFGVAEIKCKKKMVRWVAWGTNEKATSEYLDDAVFQAYDEFSIHYPYYEYACSHRR